MFVNRIMTREVDCVAPHTSIEQAARIMRERNVGALPVTVDARIVGIVTDRDIVLRAVAENKIAMFTRVAEIMSPSVVSCKPDDDIEDVIMLMARSQVRRMPVTSASGTLLGIVALADIALNEDDAATFALVEISEPIAVIADDQAIEMKA